MKLFKLRKISAAITSAGLLILSTNASASAFQLWEQDAASIGNYHAGYAAAAYDASTAFYNPAGLSRFKNQQFVLSGDAVLTNFNYTGTIAVDTINANTPAPVSAQGGLWGFVPAFHYVAPINNIIAFGFSVDVPFGLKIDYGTDTILRYASTETSVRVIDISPVLSFKLNKYFSIGLGPDLQVMQGEFNQIGTSGGEELDSDGINSADDTAFGMHAGILYEMNENSRIGLSYHSQVVHHLTGTSTFSGPLADFFDGPIRSSRNKLNLTLPPYTALSLFHQLSPKFVVMGSVIYTQWSTIKDLVLQDVAGLSDFEPSTGIVVTIPQFFVNTFNVSVGGNYIYNDKVTLRGGLGYDQTPVRDAYRTVMLPDNTRYVVALGGHYQTTKSIGFDVGWSHYFMNKSHVIPPVQVTGDERVTTNGSINGRADVFAAQIVWDLV